MIVSDARREANRRNSLLSTGPRTEEGKRISRGNALKHGLCATVVQAEDLELVQARTSEFFRTLYPQNEFQAWMVSEAAILSIRIDRCERIERRVRDKISLRAELTWDDDRDLEAELLGGGLASRPSETLDALRRTPHGCDWLMKRWALLAHAALNHTNQWTEEQTSLAFDLLGTPAMFRAGNKPGEVIDLDGNVMVVASSLAEVARRMLAELKERREVVAGLDEVERTLVVVDLDHDSDPEIRRLRRYESVLHSRFRWTIGQVKADPIKRPFLRDLLPKWLTSVMPTTKPEPKSADEILAEKHPVSSIHPPFDLEPDEFPPVGQKADVPAILKSRRDKKRRKEQTLRNARRRRVEALRN